MLDVSPVPDLDVTLFKLKHERTGADLWHLSRDDPNNVFCVAFKTPTSDSTGVPHILEHTTLCGSSKYPVRDPFFKMLNRSLASYMNAWTASDHTAYPFCTANPQDYVNLRDVYFDAVFSPRLSRYDFLQEGWRLEKDGEGFKFKGVVYNEMKGAFSDIESLFSQRLQQSMFPGTLYSHVSGGDPLSIPQLTHQQLVEFHRKHYHPSNALFYTYGDMPLLDTLAFLDEKLAKFTEQSKITIDCKTSPMNPKTTISCPIDPSKRFMLLSILIFIVCSPEKQYKMTLAFMMNDVSADPQETFHLKILSHLLLEGSSAPMYKVLIDSNIGQDYASSTGYDSSTKIATFSVGLQGIREEDVELVKRRILETLQECQRNGFNKEKIDGVVNLLEIGTKVQSAQVGLALSHRVISSWVFNVDPLQELDINSRIESFKEAYAKGGLFERLIGKYFLNNPNRQLFVMKPDASYEERLAKNEETLLTNMTNDLTPDQISDIEKESEHLKQLQETTEDLSVLPCLRFEDIKRESKKVDVEVFKHNNSPKYFWRTTNLTNGITYMKSLFPLTNIDESKLKLLPLVCQLMTELGVAGKPIDKFDEDTKLFTGGLQSSLFLGRHPWGPIERPELAFSFGTFSLNKNIIKSMDLLKEAIFKTDFSNMTKLRSVISSAASSMMNSIASSGHGFAISKAASNLSLRGALDEQLHGLAQVAFLNNLTKQEDTESIMENVKTIAQSLFSNECRASIITSEKFEEIFEKVQAFHRDLFTPSKEEHNMVPGLSESKDEFIEMPFASNYAAQVFQFDPYNLKQSANLSVLARLLRSKLLHKEIREMGGAYGGGASYSSLNGLFSFYSYRDPNPTNSLTVFDKAPQWFLGNYKITDQDLLEAKLSVFSSLDAPIDISSEGQHEFLYGITDVDRQLYRDQLILVDDTSLKEAAETLSKDNAGVRCVIGHINPFN